jgi:DNA polymerase II small subunit/DNA polymerase delta subunit B
MSNKCREKSVPWTEYEEKKLKELRDRDLIFPEIAAEFRDDPKCNHRTSEAIRLHFNTVLNANQKKPKKETPSDTKIVSILKQHKILSLYELADELDISPKKTKEAIELLIADGKRLEMKGDSIEFMAPQDGKTTVLHSEEDGWCRFGFVSDTHIGSKKQQMSALKDFYREMRIRGIKKAFHSGDWVAGKHIYRGQEYELFLHSMREQKEYLVQEYPDEGIETIGIAGNHDYSWSVLAGDSILEMAVMERSDIKIVGEYQAFVEWNGFRFSLHHPDGGQAYAISYKLQKLVESFTAENLPDFVEMGHYHQKEYVTIRGVECFQPGCFEAQSPYLIRKNLHPAIGGWIVEAQRKENRTHIIAEFLGYKPIENDW